MIKVNSIKHDKLWGFEIWLYSPLKGMETKLEDGTIPTKGPLIKILHANMPLSVQVHPDDELALKLENQPNGKTESWYVLKANKDSELVIGLKSYDEKIIRESLSNRTFKSILKTVVPKPGEFYNIQAGLVHGVGAGMEVLEVQQPSDTTYRYYDYDRKDDEGNYRELHVDKAITSQKDISWELNPINNKPLTYVNSVTKQSFHKELFVIEKESVIVNLDNFDCFVAKKGEKINFANYAVIVI